MNLWHKIILIVLVLACLLEQVMTAPKKSAKKAPAKPAKKAPKCKGKKCKEEEDD